MSQHELKVEKRTVTGKEAAKVLRREGKLPAVLYGHGETPVIFSVGAREFNDLVSHHGSHSLIILSGDGNGETAIIKSVQRHPWRGNHTTVDFQRVSRTEKITVTVPLIVTGEPLDVKTGDGVLVQSLHEIEVRASASDTPESVHVDVSALVLNGPALTVAEIPVPAGLEIVTAGTEAVAAVNPQQVTEEDEAIAAEEAAASEAAAEAAEAPEATEEA